MRSKIYKRPAFSVRALHSTFQSAGELKNLLSTLGFNVDIVQVTPGIMRGKIRASQHPEALAIEIQSNQGLLVTGNANPNVINIAIERGPHLYLNRVQGHALPENAISGFNSQKKEIYYSVSPGSRLCAGFLKKKNVIDLANHLYGEFALDRLASNNICRIAPRRFALLSNSIINRLSTTDSLNQVPAITTDFITSFVDALCCHQGVDLDAEKPLPNKDLVRDFVKYSLEKGTKEPITIDQHTKNLFTSKTVLSSAIKKSTGLSPLTFLRNIRLEQVRTELDKGDPKTSVIDIAHRHGFPSRGHFSRYYREQFGELPRETLAKA